MLKLVIRFVVIFNIFLITTCEQLEKDVCETEIVQFDQDFLRCCRKPTYTSENCIAMSEYNNSAKECFANCMYTDLKFYDGEKFYLDTVQKFLVKNGAPVDVQNMFRDAFQYCTDIDKDDLINMFTFAKLSTEEDCDLYPSYVDLCIWYHSVSHCPVSYMNLDDKTCSRKIEWVHHCLLK